MIDPRPADGVALLLCGDEGVLFSAPRQELHRLNTMGAVIWCYLEDGLAPPAMAGKLETDLGLDAAQATAFVAQALAGWAAAGLLEGGAAPPDVAGSTANPDWPGYPSTAAFVMETHYALAGVALRYRFTDPAHADLVHPVLAHLAAPPGDGPCVDIVGDGARVAVFRDGVACAGWLAADELAPVAKHAAWSAGLLAADYLLDIHAGVAVRGGGAVLLPAPPGSGKSTLTAALVQAGWQFYSDEVALLCQPDFAVRPFPLALCVKDTGLSPVAALFPQVRQLPVHRRGDGKRVAYLPPPPAALRPAESRATVRALLFPQYCAGAALRVQDLPAAEALQRLLGQCLSVARPLDLAAVRGLVGWIGGLRCAALEYGALDDAVAAAARYVEST